MLNLNRIKITFDTHNDDKDDDTILHVFVKNRSFTSSTPEASSDYITNHLAYESYEAPEFAGINPYLGRFENLAPNTAFDDPSSNSYDISLRSRPIPLEEVVLPVVNIHILPNGNDQWAFSYKITFYFDDGNVFSASSDSNGVAGIVLDQNNRDYSGICVENPFIPLPPLYQPQTDAFLTQVKLVFATHDDDGNKDNDTQLNVHIVNRLNAASSQDIAIGLNVLTGQEFADGSVNTIVFSQGSLPLASSSIKLRDIVLPAVNINIAPNGNDTWIFDYQVFYTFSNGQTFFSQTSGIVLDQDNHKYFGVYQGDPFPTVTPPGKPQLYPVPVNHVGKDGAKRISLSFLQRKLDEFVNCRQGLGSEYPPIRKIRLHNTGSFDGTLPESYYDLQSIDADPPAPGTLSPPGAVEGVKYDSSPTSLGQQTHAAGFGDFYFNDINSKSITANIDATSPTPLTLEVQFDCSGSNQIVGGASQSFFGMDLKTFSIQLLLTLTYDQQNKRVDLLSWIPEINDLIAAPILDSNSVQVSGQFLGQPINTIAASLDSFKSALKAEVIDLTVVTSHTSDPGGFFRSNVCDKIFSTLSDPAGRFDASSLRDKLNSYANSWLVGGVLASDRDINGNNYTNGCVVNSACVQGDELVIDYTGPQMTFSPPTPANWPPVDFTPGNLANIDHIVVLTMENRSFDHILGYLSLPPAQGGMGRANVDGLKGGEFNIANGVPCPSFLLHPEDTIMAPDPPHDSEPVFRAINDGKMDGFAQSYCDERGPDVAPRIMGYHTAANVPTYDALARDFAVGHRWFASHPGPTFCNRFYELTGRLNVDPDGFWEFSNSSPLRAVFTPTIFDILCKQGVSWKYFEHFYCFLRFFEDHTFDPTNIASFDDPVFGFTNLARTGNLPSVSFIDPHFIELPPGGNCDGPPADVQKGQEFVQQVVDAVISGPLWPKTLLIIVYDEHGGFYDHVPPPAATRVSLESLGTYGVRVPAFLISPWVNAGSVFGHDGILVGRGNIVTNAQAVASPRGAAGGQSPTRSGAAAAVETSAASGGDSARSAPSAAVVNNLRPLHFDHTSILKTIARRFLSRDPPYLGARYADAQDLSAVIGNQLRSGPFLPFICYNFVYGASQKRLDVQTASTSPGGILWQYDPNNTIAQRFSFEDAGEGHFYIRTHTGRLYLTASQDGVTQEVRYPTDGSTPPPNNPDAQRWVLTPSGIVVTQRNHFTISNAAFSGMVLQPAGDSTDSGIAVVLAAPTKPPGSGPLTMVNPWQVTSPLLPNNQTLVNAFSN